MYYQYSRTLHRFNNNIFTPKYILEAKFIHLEKTNNSALSTSFTPLHFIFLKLLSPTSTSLGLVPIHIKQTLHFISKYDGFIFKDKYSRK